MKKTFCDRCGVECNGEPVQRFTIFDVNKSIDVCDNCYREFFRWLENKESNNGEDEFDDFFDSCDHCEYHDKETFEFPCRECKNCDRKSMVDHYIRKENDNE